MFVAELGFLGTGRNSPGYTKNGTGPRAIFDLELDAEAMRELGVDYLLSALRIDNPRDSDLEFVEVFEHSGSPWQIHLYRLGER